MLVSSLIILMGCENEVEESAIIEPAGHSIYFIDNNSGMDLSLAIVKSKELGLETDSIATLRDKHSEKVFEDGTIGSIPKPSDSFSELRFYDKNVPTRALIIISPVMDKDWILIEDRPDGQGLGLKVYEFRIAKKMIGL
jgi:hypothetical protein